MAVVQGAALSAITTADFELRGPLSAPSACLSVVVTGAAEPSLLIQHPPVRGRAVQREHASVQPQQPAHLCVFIRPLRRQTCVRAPRMEGHGAGT
ncbi:unnamed protein product [Gadus morhua 'NCC']